MAYWESGCVAGEQHVARIGSSTVSFAVASFSRTFLFSYNMQA